MATVASFSVESKEFLSSCLRSALEDPELVDDISDQALEHGFNALSIGTGQVTVEQLKNQLYLTVEEAKSVMDICVSKIAGHQSKEQPQQDHVSLRLKATPSGHIALKFNGEELLSASTRVPQADVEALDAMMENAAVVVISRAPTTGSSKKMEIASPLTTFPMVLTAAPTSVPGPAPLPAPGATPTPAPAPSSSPVPARAESPFPCTPDLVPSAAPTPAPVPAPAPTPAPAVPIPAPSPVRPPAPSPAAAKPLNPGKASNPAASKPSTPAKAPNPAASKPSTPAKAPSPAAAKPSTPAKAPSPAPKPSTPAKAPTPSKPAEPLLHPEPSSCSPRLNSRVVTSSPASSTPSYLRPTATHNARLNKDGVGSPAVEPLPTVSEEGHDTKHGRTLFNRMSSTLLAPTQASVARVNARSEDVKSKKDNPVGRASAQLDASRCGLDGQRVTKPQPFFLQSDARITKSCVLTTEELRMAEAREKAPKRKPVPKHVHESRPIAPTQRSEPKDPKAVFEPFKLVSEELHKKKAEERKKKQEEEAAREAEGHKFKARAFDPSIKASPVKPAKPPASPPTRGVAPALASEARIAHYKTVVEPAKKAKEVEKDKERAEAERKAKELEDMSMDDYRKTLEFKARAMPDFSAPFQPDPSLTKPPTAATEPEFHTAKRLGAPPSPSAREDKEGSGLGKGVFDGAGYVDPFSASLRKSSSATSSQHGSNPGSKNPSMRRSLMLRQTTATTNSGAASRTSSLGVGTADLQAAIKKATCDAARDLAAAGGSMEEEQEGETSADLMSAGGIEVVTETAEAQ